MHANLQQTSPLRKIKLWFTVYLLQAVVHGAQIIHAKNASYEKRGLRFVAVRLGIVGPQMIVSALAIVLSSGIFP